MSISTNNSTDVDSLVSNKINQMYLLTYFHFHNQFLVVQEIFLCAIEIILSKIQEDDDHCKLKLRTIIFLSPGQGLVHFSLPHIAGCYCINSLKSQETLKLDQRHRVVTWGAWLTIWPEEQMCHAHCQLLGIWLAPPYPPTLQ